MNWLSQNWIWVALAIGAGFFFLRSGHGGHAGGHGGGLGGLLGGMGHGGGYGGHSEPPDSRATSNAPEAAVDPVGGEAVHTAQALTSLYQGKIYYFASKENRDRFEAAPHEYARKLRAIPRVRPDLLTANPAGGAAAKCLTNWFSFDPVEGASPCKLNF